VEYYLRLTATSDSPHIALIGPRGVGKTSLLNAIEASAKKLGLAPIRIDLDEHKTSAPGVFWQNFYATLLLAAGDLGCWGGPQGRIYTALFQMIHARRPALPSDIVLQFPAVLAANDGPLNILSCPDTLIHRDLLIFTAELRDRGYLGVAALIDEADCLGQNRPLIQMFRNIFQRLESFSLILAGTEAVFPTLTDVFSPIPRQFHRVDVQPFKQWPQTQDLVTKPFDDLPYSEYRRVLPSFETVQALHDLCGGDPSELQLYCHHMYKLAERNEAEKMTLAPQVFREVVHEFRAFAPADLGNVLASIEGLPDKLLFGSPWLRRHRLTLEENVECTVLAAELKEARQLTDPELAAIRDEIREGYATLHRLGITRDQDRLDLVGDTFTAGFWKSFVEAEKSQRWSWDEAPKAGQIPVLVLVALAAGSNATVPFPAGDDSDGVESLAALRRGASPVKIGVSGMVELLVAVSGHEKDREHITGDATVTLTYGGKKQSWRVFYSSPTTSEAILERLASWLTTREKVLERHGIRVTVEGARIWESPNAAEMQRLAYISELGLPEDDFGKSLAEEALTKFSSGDIDGTVELFSWMLEHRPIDGARNNIAYCEMLRGNHEEAKNQFAKMSFQRSDSSWPIWQHNYALLKFLMGDQEEARRMLQQALDWTKEPRTDFDPRGAFCMLLLQPGGRRVVSQEKLPIDAAILLNMLAVNALSPEQVTSELAKRYPDEYKGWLVLQQ